MRGFNPTLQYRFKEAGCRKRQGSSEKNSNDKRINEDMFFEHSTPPLWGIDPLNPMHGAAFGLSKKHLDILC
jgi:hypothetical protein